MEAWQIQNLQVRPAGWRLREELQFKSKGHVLAEFLLTEGRSVFVLFRPSTDWMRPTHFMESNVLSSKSTDFNVNLIQKHLHRNIQKNV